jgi:hypothetical protein
MKYLVSWIIWNRDSPQWRPKHKLQKCASLDKAERLKKNLLKQTSFIEVTISEII